MRGNSLAAGIACCVLAAATMTGCGDDSSSAQTDAAATTPQVEQPSTAPNERTPAETPETTQDPGPAPRLPARRSRAEVTRLIVRDDAQGDGPALSAGDVALVDFIGAELSSGRRIGSSWGRPAPFPLRLDETLVPGLLRGLAGMRVGGRRTIIIPGRLGFPAEAGVNPGLMEAPLYYVVALRGIQRGAAPSRQAARS